MSVKTPEAEPLLSGISLSDQQLGTVIFILNRNVVSSKELDIFIIATN